MTEEDKKMLIEMKDNCLNASVYDDENRLLKANAITNVLKEIERLNNIINELEKSWKEEITRLDNFIQEDSSMIEINNIRKMLIQEKEIDLCKLQKLKGSE